MKKAVTFGELMISLVVISVIAAILYPTVAQFTPNTNKPLFKSAYKIMSLALRDITSERVDGEIPLCEDTLTNTSLKNAKSTGCNNTCTDCTIQFCIAFCQRVNVISEDEDKPEVGTCANLCADNQITTTNGMKWKFDSYDTKKGLFVVYVDVNSSNNNLASVNPPSGVFASSTPGVFYYDDTAAKDGIYKTEATSTEAAVFNTERLKSQDTFRLEINRKGSIEGLSAAGWAHLEDVVSPD